MANSYKRYRMYKECLRWSSGEHAHFFFAYPEGEVPYLHEKKESVTIRREYIVDIVARSKYEATQRAFNIWKHRVDDYEGEEPRPGGDPILYAASVAWERTRCAFLV